jgi:multidrug efflux pump subunit AcrB
VLVLTAYPGANPEVVETDVTKPLEYAINTVSGASLIRSNSREGQSQVFAEFRMSTDMSKAMQDVRDKIAQVRPNFPRDVKEPLVIRADQENQQPVVSLAVLSPTMSLRDLTSLTDQTIVKGTRERAGRRAHRRQRSDDASDSHPDQAQRGVGARHRRRPGDQRRPRREPGRSRGPHHAGQSDSIVRVEGKIKDPAQFARIVVAQQGGAPVYLSQVADVIDGEKEQDSISRINGRPSIALDIQKQQDANIVDTGRGVHEAIAALKKRIRRMSSCGS